MTTPDTGQQHALLRFARDVYTRPGIQALCLRLQDEQNVDVVLLLMCCWHGCSRGLLTEAQFEQASAFSGTWATQLVKPLRQSRRWLKSRPADAMRIPGDDQEDLRRRIKALELEAEFMQLRALASLFPEAHSNPDPDPDPEPDPASNAARRSGVLDLAATVQANLALHARVRALKLDQQTMRSLTQASIHCA